MDVVAAYELIVHSQCCHITHSPATITLIIVILPWTSQGCLVLSVHTWVHVLCKQGNNIPAYHKHDLGLWRII